MRKPEAQDALFIQQYWFPLAAEPVPPLRYYCNYHYPLWPSQRTPKVLPSQRAIGPREIAVTL